jgi:hypothetical protein
VSSNSKPLLILVLLFLVLLPVFTSRVGASSEDTATLAITQAEETFVSAYEAVLDAEQAGANVSELLDQLNIAAEHLAEARMLYRLGDFDGAVSSADLSKVGADVETEAEQLKIDAQRNWGMNLLNRLAVPIVGVIVVILATFIAWRIFKQRYFREPSR